MKISENESGNNSNEKNSKINGINKNKLGIEQYFKNGKGNKVKKNGTHKNSKI